MPRSGPFCLTSQGLPPLCRGCRLDGGLIGKEALLDHLLPCVAQAEKRGEERRILLCLLTYADQMDGGARVKCHNNQIQ